MRYIASAAVLYPVIGIFKAASAFLSQGIERAVAEQAIKFILVYTLMAREKFACLVTCEFVVFGFPY